jgi:hypothetical protein
LLAERTVEMEVMTQQLEVGRVGAGLTRENVGGVTRGETDEKERRRDDRGEQDRPR